jgi:hypothetical protein
MQAIRVVVFSINQDGQLFMAVSQVSKQFHAIVGLV